MSNPIEQAIDGLTDILNGWKYIRDSHGDLYGVGWDRAQEKAEAALSALQSLQGVELPEPVAEVVTIPMQGGKIGRAIRAIDPQWMVSADGVKLHTADQLRTAVAAAMARGAVPQPGWTAEEIEEVIACLDDDAVTLLDVNPEDERAVNMQRAAAMIQVFAGSLSAAPTPEATPPDVEDTGARCEPSDWVPPAGYDGDGSVEAMARRATQPTQAEVVSTLPERDPSKPAERQGLFRKFDVRRTDGSDGPGGKHEGCEYFVLDVDHDPHAMAALETYADQVEATHPMLASDIRVRYGIATQPTQAEAPREPGKVMLDVQGLTALAGRAQENDNPLGFFRVMLQWAEQANAEIARLRAAIATQQAVQGEAVKDLVEAVDTLLDEAICECPHKMRFEDGEHFAHCYLFDVNVARTALLATPPAPQQPEALAQQERTPMTDAQIEKLREATFSTNNPFCPVDSKSMRKAVRAAESFHRIRAARSSEGGGK